MILYPAIDLKGGRCVRLVRGAMGSATTYNDSPADQAETFQAGGCRFLHVVDLDGAFAGISRNGEAIEAILARLRIPVQLGGGIRTMDAVEHWLRRGVRRVVLGSAALRAPAFLCAAARAFPGQIALAIDTRKGKVAIEGWAQGSTENAIDLARRYEDAGIAAIIHTDINRDGTLEGANVSAVEALARAVSVPIIASGGVSSLGDLRALARVRPPLEGAIVGSALYRGSIALGDALRVSMEREDSAGEERA